MPKASAVFYYCNHADKRTLDPVNIFRSITQQILQLLGELPESVISIIEETFQDGSGVPDTADICRVLLAAIHQFCSITIFIDGIDEVLEDDRKLIFSHLNKLLSEGGPTLLKLFISGREDTTAVTQVLEIPNFKARITADVIAGDIDNYVRYAVRELIRIGDLKFRDPLLENEVVLALANGAKGMYDISFITPVDL
jgi:hypothetical protein